MYLICRVLMTYTYTTEFYISSAMLVFVLAIQMTLNIMCCVVIGKPSDLYHTAKRALSRIPSFLLSLSNRY